MDVIGASIGNDSAVGCRQNRRCSTIGRRARCLLLAATTTLVSVIASAAPEIGKTAPAFAVRDSDGKLQTLADHLGKVIILEWTNAECPLVGKYYDSGTMQKLQRTYTDKGAVWLSVVSSAKGKQGYLATGEAGQLTKQRNAAPTAVLLDDSGSMGRGYDARTTPHIYIIDTEGVLAYMGGIDSIASTDAEEIAKATPYLAQAADAVLAGEPVAEPVTKPYGCSIRY